MSAKVKINLTPYELWQFDRMLGSLIVFRNEADAWERLAMTVLSRWHEKIERLAKWAKPEGNKVTLNAEIAYALIAVIPLEELRTNDALSVKLLDLADQIQRTFFRPFYNPPIPPTSYGTDQNENPNTGRL